MLPTTKEDRENLSFVESPSRSGKSAREVVVANQELLSLDDYDNIAVTYPTSTTEQYLYTLSGDTVRTVLVTYATSDKENITNVAFS